MVGCVPDKDDGMTLNLVNIMMTMVVITTMVFRIPSLLRIIGLLLRRVVLKLLRRRRRVVLKLLRRRVEPRLLRVVSRLLRVV